MPGLTIKYKNKKTLEALIDLSKYFGFSVVLSKKPAPKKNYLVNGVIIIPGDNSVDVSELETIFSGRKIEAKQLRKDAWQRVK